MYDELFSSNKRNSDLTVRQVASKKSVDDLLFEASMEAESEDNYPHRKLNLEGVGENLRIAANTADRIIGVTKIIEEAKRENPKGLPW